MGCLIEKILFKKGIDKINKLNVPSDLWSIPINDIEGVSTSLSNYTGNDKKAFLFVNVACK